MRYWGKVVGLAVGLLSGAGFWGIVIGFDHWPYD
ncbi:DnaJ-like protein DjlA [Pantoea agglomerans]|uniref:DnaJ-like protein DjlA n=1 Tax=Enterobacter agglomerans TaxID=549 RepID=A0A379ALM6_ENTAG|nr:DnaJ-like protein DjlA [Pantoea agglomerans]